MSVRAVVRGAGSIGRRHAVVLRDLGAETQLWPVRDRVTPTDCDADVPLVAPSDGIAACADADLVVVATDTARHVQDAVTALDSGCGRVLLEKPVAPDFASCQRLLNHPRAGDVFVAAPLRAHLGFREVMSRTGAVGQPVSAYICAQSWLPDWRPRGDYRRSYSARADEGGVLRDLIHEIDYASLLFGSPTFLLAQLEHNGPLDVGAEQGASMLWRTTSGATIMMRLDYISRPRVRRLELHSPDGSLCWDVATATVRATSAKGKVTKLIFSDDLDRNIVMTTQVNAALSHSPLDEPAILRQAGAPATLAEGCAAVAICDQAREFDAAVTAATTHRSLMEGMNRP